ncbi:MAG: DUF4199 domain-containing protein [Bacteroidetes bacterium]|nr:DUF4199 domain-containing protein [Bacteroidota bacterium]
MRLKAYHISSLFGGILTLAALMLNAALKPTGAFGTILYYLPMLLLIASIYAAVKIKRREEDDFISFKTALQTGFGAAIIVTLFFAVGWFYGINNESMGAQLLKLKEAGKSNKEIIDLFRTITPSNITNRVLMFVIMQLLMGFFITMGTALILKKEKRTL